VFSVEHAEKSMIWVKGRCPRDTTGEGINNARRVVKREVPTPTSA
jgi:hypothetical protein